MIQTNMVPGNEIVSMTKGWQLVRPGSKKRNYAISYQKFARFVKSFHEYGGNLKLVKSEPWYNCIGAVNQQVNSKGNLDIVEQRIIVYVWDTKKIIAEIPVPLTWYLENPENSNDKQDFISIFITEMAIPFLIVPDPIPGPYLRNR